MLEKDKLYFVPLYELEELRNKIITSGSDCQVYLNILATILRINILYMIKNAGSGHIGTSFSSLEMMLWLWMMEMRGANDSSIPNSDTFFSSKGHDAPALYAVMVALGKICFNNIHQLRKMGGLPGHPDIHTPFVAANTGSLGMGISKARGMAIANRLRGSKGRIFIIIGDGELQEGQIWESLQPAANGNFSEITVLADLNQIQSDREVSKTSHLGPLVEKFKGFGWNVSCCNGNDFSSLKYALDSRSKEKPNIILAKTKKGFGVSFMECLDENGFYKYHSGAPSDEDYYRALEELTITADRALMASGMDCLLLVCNKKPEVAGVGLRVEKLIQDYGEELCELGKIRTDMVVLNADLVVDCGLVGFKNEFPERFVECGIAEQDMVSAAGGLALKGVLPIVNSFGCFLSTRPNEQIYNNATEKTKIIYTAPLAGLLPAGPGHSHQSVRDISLVGAIPGVTIFEPCNEIETKLALRWAVNENPESTYIRLVIIPVEITYKLPAGYQLNKGQGIRLYTPSRVGSKTAILAYGPVMLGQAINAAREIEADLYNFPWLNFIDEDWFYGKLARYKNLVVVDDHYTKFGLGALIGAVVAKSRLDIHFSQLGLEEIPVCGQTKEVLRHHQLDDFSIAERITDEFKNI